MGPWIHSVSDTPWAEGPAKRCPTLCSSVASANNPRCPCFADFGGGMPKYNPGLIEIWIILSMKEKARSRDITRKRLEHVKRLAAPWRGRLDDHSENTITGQMQTTIIIITTTTHCKASTTVSWLLLLLSVLRSIIIITIIIIFYYYY